MGRRGPKPLPANVHQLRGNPSKLPQSRLVDDIDPEIDVPSLPRHLWPEARKEWRRISAELVELGLVTRLDRAALALYCQWWAKWVWAEQAFARSREVAEQRRQAHVDRAVATARAALRERLAVPADVTDDELDVALQEELAQATAAAALDAEATWTGGDGMMVPTPSGALIYSPHWVAAKTAALYVEKFLAQFGLSPSSRGRVSPSNNRQGTLFPPGDGEKGAGGAPAGFAGI